MPCSRVPLTVQQQQQQANNKNQDEDQNSADGTLGDSRKESSVMTAEELEELKRKQELRAERQRLKEEMERKEKEKLERLRRRRFPMEDTRLHEEDKEFGIATTTKQRRPAIPYFFQIVRDFKSTVQTPSRCDAMDVDTRGLVPDLLQVYHFFRGDVRFCDIMTEQPNMTVCCDFSLSHLMYAVDEVLMGNARKCKLVPPLLQHLFLCCLSLLTSCMTMTRMTTQQQENNDN